MLWNVMAKFLNRDKFLKNYVSTCANSDWLVSNLRASSENLRQFSESVGSLSETRNIESRSFSDIAHLLTTWKRCQPLSVQKSLLLRELIFHLHRTVLLSFPAYFSVKFLKLRIACEHQKKMIKHQRQHIIFRIDLKNKL